MDKPDFNKNSFSINSKKAQNAENKKSPESMCSVLGYAVKELDLETKPKEDFK